MNLQKALLVPTMAALIASSAPAFAEDVASLKARIAELEVTVADHEAERARTKRQLETFDELDIVAFNTRDMERIAEIHADEVAVFNPDGSLTTPYKDHHDKEPEFLFHTFDFQIPEHVIGFGYDDWTAGVSVSHGKWVEPIKLSDGRVLEPTGKEFAIRIATLAKWEAAEPSRCICSGTMPICIGRSGLRKTSSRPERWRSSNWHADAKKTVSTELTS